MRILSTIALILFSLISTVNAATVVADSCSLADVRNAVNEASRGDTVVVPPGSCDWNDTVTIQKAITFQGSGSDSTLIISKFEANGKVPGYPFVRWNPSPLDEGYVFRITGFQFDSQNYTAAFRVDNSSTTFTPSLRIDNNRFIKTERLADSPSTEPWETRISMTMMFFGLVKGVIDNNYFSGKTVIQARRGNSAWTTPTVSSWDNGTDDNVFFEDNYFYRNDSMNQVVLSGAGGSFVARYNTFDCTLRTGYFYNADTHGAQPGPSFSGFGAEMYGNKIIAPNATGQRIAEFRGGIHKVFYNKSISSVQPYITLWETYSPTYSKASTRYICPAGSLYLGTSTCSIDGRSQNVEKSYFWNNLYGTAEPGRAVVYNNLLGTNPYPDPSVTKAKALRENSDFWLPQTSFNGKQGVGCGTLANRPSTCTTGVGYWATDQSCTEVADDSLGVNPKTPIQGILYRCVTTDNWQTYYTPYAYPHPLRAEDDTEEPRPYNFTPSTEQACTATPYSSIDIGLRTNENATCKWDTSVDDTPTYAELSNAFTGSGSTTHTSTVANLNCGQTATIYYACIDSALNTSAVTSSQFYIASGDDTEGPVTTDLTEATQQFSFLGQLLSIQTNKAATCRYCATCASDTAWASRTQFGVTGDINFHVSNVSQAKSSTVVYEIMCVSTQGYYSTNREVSITTTDTLGMTVNSGGLTGTIQDTSTVSINF